MYIYRSNQEVNQDQKTTKPSRTVTYGAWLSWCYSTLFRGSVQEEGEKGHAPNDAMLDGFVELGRFLGP